MSRSPEGEAEVGLKKKSLYPDLLVSSGRLTAVVLQHLLSDHGVAVAAGHQVGRQHHRVDLLLLDRLVARDPTSGADDAEAPQAMPCRSGDVELHVETCRKASRRQREEPGKVAQTTKLPRRVPGGETPGAEPSPAPTRYLRVQMVKAELAAQDGRPHVPQGSHKVSTNPDTPSRPCFKKLELTGHLEELSGALAVSPRREFKGFPQGGALQLHQVEGSPEGQDGEQVLHRDGACGRNTVTLSAADTIFFIRLPCGRTETTHRSDCARRQTCGSRLR